MAALCLGLAAGGLLAGAGLTPQRGLAAAGRILGLGPRPPAELPGQWKLAREDSLATAGLDPRKVQQLLALGYAGGTVPAGGAGGVTVLDRERSQPGLRLFCSGHAPEAFLMTREGEVVHRWGYDYEELRRSRPRRFLPAGMATGCWRRVRLLPDGSLLAIYEGHGLVALDRDSRLLWASPLRCHHDLDVDAEGRIWVLTREPRAVPDLHPTDPVLVDYVTVLAPGGEVLRQISILDALRRSPSGSLLPEPPAAGDVLHTNTLELLDGRLAGRLPAFAAGNVLISIRKLDAVAVLDPGSERIAWALAGLWDAQHEPTVLDDGTLLLFDNLGRGGRSQVLQIDPATQRVAWRYPPEGGPVLLSRTCGAARRLPNGDTLVVESDNGRALEVTPDGETVWEYRNPRRAGEHDELVAAILDMVILPEGLSLAWLDRP